MSETSDGKPYRIVYEEYPTYLYALVHGEEYGYHVLAGFLTEIAAEVKRRGLERVIIEENISATTTKEDAFRVASEMPDFGYAGIRLAYIDRFSDQKDINEFGHDVAVDNGIEVEIFNDQGEAEKWLNRD